MYRPASLACLEGIVLEKSSEDSDSSADSICFVFMGQRGSEADAHFRGMGSSFTASDTSERMIFHSRSTESIPFERDERVLPFSEHSASLDNIYSTMSSSIQRKLQLHRSRSASLLDVAANAVCDENENIFPPTVGTDSETSVDAEGEGLELDSAHTDVSTITNPTFIHRPSLVEPAYVQHMYLTSPTQLYTSRRDSHEGDWQDQRSSLGAEGGDWQRHPGIVEVESGQPYFRLRTPGAQPQQSESVAQTEAGAFPQHYSHPLTSAHSEVYPRPQGQARPVAGEAVNTRVRQTGRPLSPSGERWMELSDLMVETNHILQNLQQTLPSPRSPAGSQPSPAAPGTRVFPSREVRESASTQTESWPADTVDLPRPGPQKEELEQTVETGTQTPGEQFSPRLVAGRYPALFYPLEPQTIVIKVKDTLTQTGASLANLSTVEVQTDAVTDRQLAGSLDASVRPDMKDGSSSMEGMMSPTNSTSQTNAMSRDTAARDASRNVGSQWPSDSIFQTESVNLGTDKIQRKTKDASSSYDALHTSDTFNQSNVLPTYQPGPAGIRDDSRDSSAMSFGDRHDSVENISTPMKSRNRNNTVHTSKAPVSVCTQMSMDSHPRCFTVQDAADMTSISEKSMSDLSIYSSQERGNLHESIDSKCEDDVPVEKYVIVR